MDIFSIELSICNNLIGVISNKEAMINKRVDNKVTTPAGRAFKFIGMNVVPQAFRRLVIPNREQQRWIPQRNLQ